MKWLFKRRFSHFDMVTLLGCLGATLLFDWPVWQFMLMGVAVGAVSAWGERKHNKGDEV